jgi:hypothetical protein
MSITAEFLRDNRLIVVHFNEVLDLGEYIRFIEKTHADYYDHADAPIHAILNLSNVQGLPRNVLSNALSVSKMKHRNDGIIVFVGSSDMTMRMIEGFIRLNRASNHRMSRTVEDAIDQIDAVMAKETVK